MRFHKARQEVKDKAYAPLPKQVVGQHLWVMAGLWRVHNPTAGQVELDRENLLTIDGPGCLWCEKPYSESLARQRCRAPVARERGERD